MNGDSQSIFDLCNGIKKDLAVVLKPPSEGEIATNDLVLPMSIFLNTRGYIERVVNQINGSYEKGWFDCCAVMIRRLLETLIIECYEKFKIESKIKDKNGDFFFLGDLITIMLKETAWNLSRNSKQALPKLKMIGDLSAHSRRYNAHREDIDKILDELRIASQELLYLAGLK